MEPDRLSRLVGLFDELVAMDPRSRAARLERVGSDDPPMREQLERLLGADASSQGERVIAAAVRGAASDLGVGGDRGGTRAGPYLLERLLGRGGMGVVYIAERADDAYRAKVAVKLVPQARFSRDLVRRFRAERQILALLEHPNIARLLDGGALSDGTPFLVMEYVDGVPIDRYCDASGATIPRRLQLVLRVCDAVFHAHRRLIVHRDIKPGNILVSADGVPKLLDFGIAKLLEPGAAPSNAVSTVGSLRLMTPAYASPEQVTGGTITTATDVYGLGLLLYELLTGTQAHRFDDGAAHSPLEVERVITATVPVRPSDAIDATTAGEIARARGTRPAQLRKILRGDLDTIVMTALQKAPERRYQSVEHLASELRAYLGGLPMSARPTSWSYRTKRFIARHRVGVAAGATAALLLAGFSATTALQARRAARERETAVQVSDFLAKLFEAAGPADSTKASVTARQLLALGAARVDSALAGQPAVQAALLFTLGQIYNRLGLSDSALTLVNHSIDIRRQLGEHDVDLANAVALRGQLLRELGRRGEAIGADSEALRLQRSLMTWWR
ncbi:MAG: serine/threonine-protein kinase [Gemmatimonadaceae bacterium]